MLTFPNAKINIGLRVTQKRADGFHNIESVFYPIAWSDILEIVDAQAQQTQVQFTTSGLPIAGEPSANLCLRAYHLLQKAYNLPLVRIHLHKVIPMGAGLGGGSSDAAFTLKLLNEKFELHLTPAQLKDYASQLGSDCAFFIDNTPAFATQKGEVLAPFPLNLEGHLLCVIVPPLHSNTAQAYQQMVSQPAPAQWQDALLNNGPAQWPPNIVNDFEPIISKQFQQIQHIRQNLLKMGAQYAAMTGSGTGVFALFEKSAPNTPSDQLQAKITQLSSQLQLQFADCACWVEALSLSKVKHIF